MAISMNMSKYVVQQPVKIGTGEAPGHCTNISVTEIGNNKISVKWKDPTEGIWGGTKLVIKKGSKPLNENDGCIIIDSNIKDQYENTGCEVEFDNSLDTDTYYVALFPYSPLDSVNRKGSGVIDFLYRKAITFESCSLDELSGLIDDGSAYTIFHVGDVKTITLNDGTKTQLRIGRIDNTDDQKRIFLETINCPVRPNSNSCNAAVESFVNGQLPEKLHSMMKTIKHLESTSSSMAFSYTAYVPMQFDYYLESSSYANKADTRLTYYSNVSSDRSLLSKYSIEGNQIEYGLCNSINNLYYYLDLDNNKKSASDVYNVPIVFAI